eukprot:6212818-Pleurochrysis_carterae.AAC.3
MHLSARGSSLRPCSASGRRAYAGQNIGRYWLTDGDRPVLRSCGVMLSSAASQRWCVTLEIRLACVMEYSQ